MTTSSSSSMKRALSREPDGDRRPTTFIQDSTAKKRRVSESGDSVTASSVSSPSTSAPLTNTTVKIEDEEEDSLQSQPSRWLVTEGSKHYPTPPNCKKRNDNWAKNRKDWLKDQRYFFDWKGMEIQKVLWRDDGIAVDWILKNPTQPVWNDTLTRPTAQELAELNGPHRSPTLPASPVPAPLVQPALNRLAENSVSQSIAQPVDPRTPTTSPPRSYSAYSPTTSPNNPLNYGSGSQIPNTSPSVPTASPALTTSMLPPAALPSQVSAVQSSSIRTSVPPIVTLQDENTLVRPPPTERLPSRPAIVVPQPPVIPMEDVIDLTESPPPSSAAHPSRMAVDERPLDIALALKRSVPTNRPTPSSHISLPVGPSHLAQKSQMPSHLKREPTETLRLVNEFIIACVLYQGIVNNCNTSVSVCVLC
ncbi:hypothetical protein DL96DRAFT_670095 [Flagelloscypha sp. PMI_526]|nr:hypothetical protein DL96DRAFT_670095 [Flagelloscypha sp. PMI_526]